MATVDRYLVPLVKSRGSDLHLSAGRLPFVRVHGVLSPFPGESQLESRRIFDMLQELMPEENIKQLERDWDTDCAYEIPGVARFRVNGFRDMRGYSAVFRVIPEHIPSFEELNLPDVMRDFCLLSKGLVVITGPTGSGKSTTLAALIDYINRHRNEHIITIEDPIEFVHTPRNCIINQREVHSHTRSFARALRSALREDPDIVLVGEIRDLETMENAIETAETGHLVFATLHTNTAATTVERMIDKFPAERQNQIRSMLADTLRGVVAQTLVKRGDGEGRIAAFEVLVVNSAVSALIREAKTHMLNSVIQTGRAQGMQTFSDELTRLAAKGIVSVEEAYIKAVDKSEMETKLRMAGLSLEFKERAAEGMRQARMAKPRGDLDLALATIEKEPDNIEALCDAAWILATSPFAELRDGRRALKLAERACSRTKEREPRPLEVLGVAQAENKNFRRALDATRRAVALYRKAGQESMALALDGRLSMFEKSQPFRDE